MSSVKKTGLEGSSHAKGGSGGGGGSGPAGGTALQNSEECLYCRVRDHRTWSRRCRYLAVDIYQLAERMRAELNGFVPPVLAKTQCSSLEELMLMDLKLDRRRQIRYPIDMYGYVQDIDTWTDNQYYVVFRDVLEFPGVKLDFQDDTPPDTITDRCFRCGVNHPSVGPCAARGKELPPCDLCSDGQGGCWEESPDCKGDNHTWEMCNLWHLQRKANAHRTFMNRLRYSFGENEPAWCLKARGRPPKNWTISYAPAPGNRPFPLDVDHISRHYLTE